MLQNRFIQENICKKKIKKGKLSNLSRLNLKCRGYTMREETKLIGSMLPSFLDPNITYNRGLALSMQIVNFLIEFLWALYCFLDFTERDLHW